MMISVLTGLLVISLVFATSIQLFFWAWCFRQLANYRLPIPEKERSSDQPPVSVIICAHNEAENLRRHLPFFLEQDYPRFEVLVINDHSNDKTLQVVLDIQNKYPTLRVLSVPVGQSKGKKAALSFGIQQASFETIFLSDADCKPISRQWLAVTQRSFLHDKTIVLGYGPYQKRRGWLNRFIRFEAFYTAIQYFSFALIGHPYMGVGRNLAYHRWVFHQANGFSNHAHLLSGDDDLLINQVATAENTAINIFPEARIYSIPKSSWRSYYIQKRRHLSVGRHYRWQHQLALGALAGSHAAFYGLSVLLLLMQPSWWPILTLNYLVRMGVVLQTSTKISKHLGERDLLPFIPLLDLAFLGYYCIFVPILLTGTRIQKWK
jgi:glycosyltransferase involved in cell wall biosynthesis